MQFDGADLLARTQVEDQVALAVVTQGKPYDQLAVGDHCLRHPRTGGNGNLQVTRPDLGHDGNRTGRNNLDEGRRLRPAILFRLPFLEFQHYAVGEDTHPDYDEDAQENYESLECLHGFAQYRPEMTAPAEILTHRIEEVEAGQRLDRVLAARHPDLSRSRLKVLIEEGRVSGDGATITEPSYRVKPGQTFTTEVPEATPYEPEGQEIPLQILYEDSELIVIDKPAGLVVHPAPGNPDLTLVNALIAHCGDSLSGIGGVRRPGIVHRLDKDTSGVMVAAKTDRAHHALSRQFEKRTAERAYLAVVWGMPTPGQDRIEGNIGRDPRNRKKMAVVQEGKGKPAATNYKIVKRYGVSASLVECRLETGRTHQVRVHMTHIGHPLVGDPLYGRATKARVKGLPDDVLEKMRGFPRQALHARLLAFDHPASGERLSFESEIPSDMKNLCHILENI